MGADGPSVERVQTGVRIEKRLLKATKGLAEYFDMSLGELLETILRHALDGKAPPFGPADLRAIEELKRVYRVEPETETAGRAAAARR